MEKAAAPTSDGTSVTMPDHGAMTLPRSRSASAAARLASAALYCASTARKLEPGHGIDLGQPLPGLQFDPALLHLRLGLHHLGVARLVRQDGDHVTLLDPVPRRTRNSVSTPPVRATAITFGRPRCGRTA